ncbi:MAG: hypothetical protein QOJ57_1671 [Thermoleophilaceae bacterium]|nr:hypothetical protein [Thermoleophilaceae bacterium]
MRSGELARRCSVVVAAVVLALVAGAVDPAASLARGPSQKKAIWGPVVRDGASQFPIYHRLGAGIYQMSLSWAQVAPTRPQAPTDPADPAYQWPADVDTALAEGRKYGIKVLLLASGSPRWANGGRGPRWAPSSPGDYADFMTAAARRYPDVKLWMVWGEPSKSQNFQPLSVVRSGRRVTAKQRLGPERYAQILDAAYAALKGVNAGNKVIGGNTFTVGTVPPLVYVRLMKLPNGKPPRMDLYGHNPFTARAPDLRRRPLGGGTADFSDLDTLSSLVNQRLARPRGKRRLRLFLSEFTLPTGHRNFEFNFWVSRKLQAKWLAAALRITRRTSSIYSLGWLSLYDDQPRADGLQVERGLLDWQGRPKPAFNVFARG